MTRESTAHDRLVRLVVGGLLLLATISLLILGSLALLERNAPDLLLGAFISVLSGAVGSLGTILTQTGRSGVQVDPPATVTVTDVPGDAGTVDPAAVALLVLFVLVVLLIAGIIPNLS